MAQAILLIADIGGYTKFMKITRANLGHSQQMVADVLEAVIDAAAPELELAKLEGDAAFFYAELKDEAALTPEASEQLLARMTAAFRKVIQKHMKEGMCECEGCVKADQLTIKFVAHKGEVAFQKVKTHRELAGVDVIIVHRMLKNDVPIREYVLMTDELLNAVPPSLKPELQTLEHDFEGIGKTMTYYAPIEKLPEAVPVLPKRSWFVRWADHLRFNALSVPYMFGLKRRPVADTIGKGDPELTSGATTS